MLSQLNYSKKDLGVFKTSKVRKKYKIYYYKGLTLISSFGIFPRLLLEIDYY